MKSFSFLIVIFYFNYVICEFKLQIMHSNDMHSHFDEMDEYGASCPPQNAKENKCYGGFARMKQAVNDAIDEAKKQNISSIHLNAGDSFQGTPYYSIFKWKVVAPLINSLKIDVMSLGNHEFDDGINNLVQYLKHVKTPVVACNLNLTSEPRLNVTNLTSSKILNISGELIGIIGYLTPDTEKIADTENLRIFDEIPKIREEAKYLKSKGVKIIIALGHSGFEQDKIIAKEVEEISLIVGGHSHTLLYTPKDKPPSTEKALENYPYVVVQKSGKQIPIVQASANCKYLGKLLVRFDDNGNVKSAEGNTLLLDASVKKDHGVDKLVKKWLTSLKQKFDVVKGYSRIFLEKTNFSTNRFESNLGNFITDAFVNIGVEIAHLKQSEKWTNAPIAMYQNGGIRSKINNKKQEGAITLEDILVTLPFQNHLQICRMPGFTLKEALELSVSEYDSKKQYNYLRYFLHFSGLRVVIDLTKSLGSRVQSITALCNNCSTPQFEPLDEQQIYSVILNSFLVRGGDTFTTFSKNIIDCVNINTTDTDAMISFVTKSKIIYPIIDGRLVVKGFQEVPSAANINIKFTFLFSLPMLNFLYWNIF